MSTAKSFMFCKFQAKKKYAKLSTKKVARYLYEYSVAAVQSHVIVYVLSIIKGTIHRYNKQIETVYLLYLFI